MKISVQSFFYSGDPSEPRQEQNWHLVSSAAFVKDPHATAIINFDDTADLTAMGGTDDEVGFYFTRDDEWQGWYETEVSFVGETPEEIEMLKGNQFRQTSKDQIVVVFLPWGDINDQQLVAHWEAEQEEA